VISQPTGVPIATAEAVDWVRGSLAQGSMLAMYITQRLEALTSAWLVAPVVAGQQVPGLDEHGHGFSTREVDALTGKLLAALAEANVGVVVVEDDLARRGDPNLGHDVLFVEDRVLRCSEIRQESAQAASFLRRNSSGYPLNAYVCRGSAAELGLQPGVDLNAGHLALIADSTRAVIASVHDGEAYVVLLHSDLMHGSTRDDIA
jgi:hypothetical protein